MKTSAHLWQYLAEFFLEWEILRTEHVIWNQNTYFKFSRPSLLAGIRFQDPSRGAKIREKLTALSGGGGGD
jgi:hypothetical protein